MATRAAPPPLAAVLGVECSLAGQAWSWRGLAADARERAAPDELVDALLLARGCPRPSLADYRAPSIRSFLPDPSGFRDMDVAAGRLADAVQAGEQVAIFGDYDVDGATSAALVARLLRDLGLAPRIYVPDRLAEGYGPNTPALLGLADEGATLVVTVDCGAQAFEPLGAARDAGLDVIVVDHHQCLSDLPPALAVVNPNRLDDPQRAEFGHLAAVGVAFLLGAALLRELRRRGVFADRAEPRLLDLLDLVALGTVADVASLHGLNRAFVAQGLRIMAGRRNPGIDALITAARLTRAPTCGDLGFALGPRINAGGRVGRADLGARLLLTEDAEEARAIATELDRLNEERRAVEAGVQAEAEAHGSGDRHVAVVAGTGWHPGVIGIVAGRLKERSGRPAIVIAIDEHGVGKGSGRSIGGVDLGSAILAAREAGLLVAGGGHAMAAGLTVAAGGVGALADFLEEHLAERVAHACANRTLRLDAILAPGGLTPELVRAFDGGGPYGAGWPAPRVAVGPVRLVRCDVVGNGHLRMIAAGDDGRSLKGIAFRAAGTPLGDALQSAPPHRRLWLAGCAKVDDWSARPAAELHVEDAAFAD